jgi:hypothetical protein
MAKILKASLFNIGLFDSDTNVSLKVTKAVDITSHCHLSEDERSDRVLLLFTRAKRGRIVQIGLASPGENIGISINFFVDELDRKMNAEPQDDSFGSWTKRLGLTSKEKFQRLITRHAPDQMVAFYKRSSWQPTDCINRSKEFKCRRKATLEAVVGSAQIRCCDRPACKKRAAMFAKLALKSGL